jgi:hypothetical protein
MVTPVLLALFLMAAVGYMHWVSVPQKIAHVQSVARKIPTTQVENLARVDALERWRIILRWVLVTLGAITVLLARALLW